MVDGAPLAREKSEGINSLDFVHTGPGTLAGRYLRRFWQPVCLSEELPRGRALPVRVMGEDFTLYRGHSGKAHLVAHRCPHRGTQLSTGLVSGDHISCAYHGWTFNPAGECVAQPAEPKPFCHKVHIDSYPTQEAMGLVFGYFGALPAPPLHTLPKVGDFTHRHRMDCNFFQSAENIMDDVHVGFSHRNSALRLSRRYGIPTVSARETSFGLTAEFRYEKSAEFNHFILPNMCYLDFDISVMSREITTVGILFYYVPIDDTHHNHFMTGSLRAPQFIRRAVRGIKRRMTGFRGDDFFSRQTRRLLSGEASIRNTLDPRLQDTATCVGQGAIADRSSERLGASDAGVILLRKVWRRELRLLAQGDPVTSVELPDLLPTGQPASR